MYICHECGSKMEAAEIVVEIHGDKIIVPGYRCLSCGEEILDNEGINKMKEYGIKI